MTATTAPDAHGPDTYGPAGHSRWLDVDWGAHQRWLTVGGRRVNLVDLGDGPPVVFVHGLSGSWQNWLENLPQTADRHRVVALDLPGFGHSEMPEEPITISGYARTVDAVLGQLGIERAAVVGNSMGGFVGAELAIHFAERVDRLVLVSAAGLSIEHLPREPLLTLARRTLAVGAWIATRSEQVARRRRLRRAVLRSVARHPERLPPALTYEFVRSSGTPGFLPALEALTSYPIRQRIPEIRCPTLVVWGRDDKLVPLRDAHEFGRLIPDSRVIVLDDTGHVPMVERPARFNAELEAFLSS